ncbi:unnamed protein product [Diplocarpon coronariae]
MLQIASRSEALNLSTWHNSGWGPRGFQVPFRDTDPLSARVVAGSYFNSYDLNCHEYAPLFRIHPNLHHPGPGFRCPHGVRNEHKRHGGSSNLPQVGVSSPGEPGLIPRLEGCGFLGGHVLFCLRSFDGIGEVVVGWSIVCGAVERCGLSPSGMLAEFGTRVERLSRLEVFPTPSRLSSHFPAA